MGDIEDDGFEDNIEDFEDVMDDVEVVKDDGYEPPDPALAYLYSHHPEAVLEYVEDVIPKLSNNETKNISTGTSTDNSTGISTGNSTGNHKSSPFLTTFERTKILGFRATQLSQGASPYIKIPEHIVDVKDIAKLELEQKRLPFILKRPMPNGTFEYWRLNDLMII